MAKSQFFTDVFSEWTPPLYRPKYSLLITIGLLFSCAGDALLDWNLFEFGMAAFGVGHIFYLVAFGFKPLKLLVGLIIYAIGLFRKTPKIILLGI